MKLLDLVTWTALFVLGLGIGLLIYHTFQAGS
jgi:hypothetical protein